MITDASIDSIALPPWMRDALAPLPQGTWIVGGTLRDILLGRPSADIDLATTGNVHRIAAAVADATAGRIVDIGKPGFIVVRVVSPAMTVDITPLAGPSIDADLRQRDFTINALAYDLHDGRLVDCTGGLRDLRGGVIRMVGASALKRDPARLVRAYRLAATLQFTVDAGTQSAVGRHRHLVGAVAGERVWAELVKLFQVPHSATVVADMAANGLLTAIFPELAPARGCRQNRYHAFDVLEHSVQAYGHLESLLDGFEDRFAHLPPLAALAGLPAMAVILKYACLLHDAGKPSTRSVDNEGRIRFYGHAARSAAIAATASRRLRLSRKQCETADAVIRHHLRPLFLYRGAAKGTIDRRGVVRFFMRMGDLTVPIVIHTMADIMAKAPVIHDRDRRFLDYCDRLLATYAGVCAHRASMPQLIDGRDLIDRFGLSPSPLIGRLLKQVDERRLAGDLADRGQALAWVAKVLGAEDGGRKTAARDTRDAG